SAHDKMARFRGHQGDFYRGPVAHLADEDDLWRLAQGSTQAIGIVVKIVTEFALVDGGFALAVSILDWVFQGNDVCGLCFINLVYEGGQGGGLATSGGAGHQDETSLLCSHLM